MKPPHRLVKILVASVFFLLIAGFVAYRSGAFENILHENVVLETKAGEYPGMTASNSLIAEPDTAKPGAKDSPPARRTLMSSSKSLIVADEPTWLDSLLPQRRIKSISGTIMSSSKSAMVVPAYKYRLSDSLVKQLHFDLPDSVRTIPYKDPTRVVLPSSKSGPMIRPRTNPDTLRKLKP